MRMCKEAGWCVKLHDYVKMQQLVGKRGVVSKTWSGREILAVE
jgi:hypothetical protein